MPKKSNEWYKNVNNRYCCSRHHSEAENVAFGFNLVRTLSTYIFVCSKRLPDMHMWVLIETWRRQKRHLPPVELILMRIEQGSRSCCFFFFLVFSSTKSNSMWAGRSVMADAVRVCGTSYDYNPLCGWTLSNRTFRQNTMDESCVCVWAVVIFVCTVPCTPSLTLCFFFSYHRMSSFCFRFCSISVGPIPLAN